MGFSPITGDSVTKHGIVIYRIAASEPDSKKKKGKKEKKNLKKRGGGREGKQKGKQRRKKAPLHAEIR